MRSIFSNLRCTERKSLDSAAGDRGIFMFMFQTSENNSLLTLRSFLTKF